MIGASGLTKKECALLERVDTVDEFTKRLMVSDFSFDECVNVLRHAQERLKGNERDAKLYLGYLETALLNVTQDRKAIQLLRALAMEHLDKSDSGAFDAPVEMRAETVVRRAMDLGLKETT